MKTFVLIDSSRENSHGFRIDLRGLDTSRFETNPVMLYAHDDTTVVGKWENLRTDGIRLMAEANFDTESEKGAEVAGQVERGYLKGCSVGIMVHEMANIDGTQTATRSELFEASVCPIPSDPGAVRLYATDRTPLTAEMAQLMCANQNDMNEQKETQSAAEEQGAPNGQGTPAPQAEATEEKRDMVEMVSEGMLTMSDEEWYDLSDALTLEGIAHRKADGPLVIDINRLLEAYHNVEGTAVSLAQELTALREQAERMSQELAQTQQERNESMVQRSIDAGQIGEAEREAIMALMKADYAATLEMLSARAKTPCAPRQSLTAMVDEDRQNAHRPTWDELDRNGGLYELKQNDPTLYAELYREKFGI